MNEYLEEARALQEEIVKNPRWLHQHAEAGEHLPQTSAYVKAQLTEIGVPFDAVNDSGIIAHVGNAAAGKCILLRADMDALPMREEAEVPFASQTGCVHACGHDTHTAMLLAVAKILKRHEQDLRGEVKLMFQPAEECLTGAVNMLRAGILENPTVDAAVTLHVTGASSPDYPVGTMILSQGLGLASCDQYKVTVTGKGGHGAHPNECIDPITAAAHIHSAFQEISARELAATDVAVITQGTFHSGIASNVIPDSAEMTGTVRALDNAVRQKILQRMRELTELIGAAFRTSAKFEICGGCAPLYNDEAVFQDVCSYLENLLGAEKIRVDHDDPAMGAEDFSNVLAKVPGIQIVLVTGCEENGQYPMHNPKLILREDSLYIGTASMAWLAQQWLADHNTQN